LLTATYFWRPRTCFAAWALPKCSCLGRPRKRDCDATPMLIWRSRVCRPPFISPPLAKRRTFSAGPLILWIWMTRHLLLSISFTAGSSFVSHELSIKLRLGFEELAVIHKQFEPLILMSSDAPVGVIETAAACAMLHSFYTEIEKILKLIARDWDRRMPSSDSWHRELLIQMSQPTGKRPAVVSSALVEVLGEFLAFRHLFRGASIALMRWEKTSSSNCQG